MDEVCTMYNFFDAHMHSTYSEDAINTVEEMCQAAIKKGLKGICFTDHCDINKTYDHHDGKKNVESFHAAHALRKKYKEIKINGGIEIAQSIYFQEEADRILGMAEYDFVLGSLHFTSDMTELSRQDYSGSSSLTFLDGYYKDLCKTAQLTDYDSLSHVTFPFRYLAKYGRKFDVMVYKKYFQKIFDTVINREKSLEINCSGLRMPMGETFPNTELIKLYFEMGGRDITLGSDAHNVVDLGEGITQTIEVLKFIGFTTYNVYTKRKKEKYKL